MSLVIDQLPDAFRRLVPELDAIAPPDERRADCSACHMAAPEGSPTSPNRFNPDTRCCTYHPTLPNFLVGRALARGGRGADKLRERIAFGEGVAPEAIKPSASWMRKYYARQDGDFGNWIELRCPYWTGGQFACGIWEDRGAVCRTYFCRFEEGPRGLSFWLQLKNVFELVERRLAKWAVGRGEDVPVEGETDDVAAWERWYRGCDERVGAIDDATLLALRNGRIGAGVRELLRLYESLGQPMPEVVVPRVGKVEPAGDRVWLSGYSRCDARDLPRSIFLLLSALDGQRRWQEALGDARKRGLDVDEAALADLYQAGIIGPDPSPDGLAPGGRTQSIVLYNVDASDLPFEPGFVEPHIGADD